ncbi:MAG: HAD-IA family hydrolase [Pseudomonadota bacterium]
MTLKLAIWDMDGTIIDSREVIQTAMERAFGALSLAPPTYEQTRQTIGLPLDEVCRRLMPEGTDLAILPDLVKTYSQAFVARRAEPGFVEPLYDGAIPALDALRADDWLIGLATGKSRRGIDAIFEMHGLSDYFDTIWCSDDGPGKPHPFMVEEAMKAVGAEPHQSLMIGDAVFDMQMGRAANVECHGVCWGFGTAEELTTAGAHQVHHGFETLSGALDTFSKVTSQHGN